MKSRRNILLCLATRKGLAVLETATRFINTHRFWVCTFPETGVTDRFDGQILSLSQSSGLEVVSLKDCRSDLLRVVAQSGIDAIVCIGWRYLVPREVVRMLNGEVIVAHDALLPKLRGFAPLPTAMIIGDREAGVTYLRAGEGPDDGPILWQAKVPIGPDDTISTMIDKLVPLYSEGAKRYLSGEMTVGRPQNELEATYSIWRDESDYWIDWNLSAEMIERSIRALGEPYLGARSRLGNRIVTIHHATVLPDVNFAIRQPGKVWSLDESGRPSVVCGSGMLRIDQASENSSNLIPLKTLRVRFE